MRTRKGLLCFGLVALVVAALGMALWMYLHPAKVDYGESDLVFVNWSDTKIASVVIRGDTFDGGCQNADGSPMDRGWSCGFEAAGYPVEVTAYDGLGGLGKALAACTIEEAPAEGERWYVTARDGAEGLSLSLSDHLE